MITKLVLTETNLFTIVDALNHWATSRDDKPTNKQMRDIYDLLVMIESMEDYYESRHSY